MAGNRIRSVRPELLEHPRFAALSDGAVRLWMGLLPCWDDEGRSLGNVGYLAGRIYFARPKSKATIGRELAELEAAGWMNRYQVAGVEYIAVRGWNDPKSECYQFVKDRRLSKFPAPPLEVRTEPRTDIRTDQRTDLRTLDQDQEGDQEGDQEQEAEPARTIPSSRAQTPAPVSVQAPSPEPSLRPALDPAPRRDRDRTPENTTQPGESAWNRRMRWWGAMLEADARLRAAGIEPNAPTLPKNFAGENEKNMARCERQLVDSGYTPAEVDAKMLHVVAVAEAEAMRPDNRSRKWFKPALIWDPERANRAVDTSIEEAKRPRAAPTQRAGPQPATPRPRDHNPPPKEVTADARAAAAEMARELAASGFQYGEIAKKHDDTTDQSRRRKAAT